MCSMSWRRPQPAGATAAARSTRLVNGPAAAAAMPALRRSRRDSTPEGSGINLVYATAGPDLVRLHMTVLLRRDRARDVARAPVRRRNRMVAVRPAPGVSAGRHRGSAVVGALWVRHQRASRAAIRGERSPTRAA